MQQWLPDNRMYFTDRQIITYSVVYTFLVMLCPYYNYFFLIPRYFIKKRYGVYALLLLLSYLVNSYIIALADKWFLLPYHPEWVMSFIHIFSRWPYILLFTLLSNWVRLSQAFYREKRQAEVLQNERTLAELKWLKAQINPHFLFNALNNIHSLIHFKSSDADIMLVKLSNLMRYLFYEGNTSRVSVSREVDYLRNYIELHLMKRMYREKVHLDVKLATDEIFIEPMLLINFVENAFKHGNLDQQGGYLHIFLSANSDSLTFKCVNSYRKQEPGDTMNGIGLENIKKRLQLLYPDTHRLDIQDSGSEYTILLFINF